MEPLLPTVRCCLLQSAANPAKQAEPLLGMRAHREAQREMLPCLLLSVPGSLLPSPGPGNRGGCKARRQKGLFKAFSPNMDVLWVTMRVVFTE